jgi:hypothetical protein
MCQPYLVRTVATTPVFALRTPNRRWAGSTRGSSTSRAYWIPALMAARAWAVKRSKMGGIGPGLGGSLPLAPSWAARRWMIA